LQEAHVIDNFIRGNQLHNLRTESSFPSGSLGISEFFVRLTHHLWRV